MIKLALLLALLVGASARAAEPQTGRLTVVAFPDRLELSVNGFQQTLVPGMSAVSLAPGSEVAISGAEAMLDLDGTILKAGPGMRALFIVVDGRAGLAVLQGRVEVLAPAELAGVYGAGEWAALVPKPAAPAPAATAAAPAPPEAAPTTLPTGSLPPAAATAAAATAPAAQPPAPGPQLAQVAPPAPAAETAGRGPLSLQLELHPFYKLRQAYDSNIYMQPRHASAAAGPGAAVVGSAITLAELGTKAIVPFNRRHTLRADYDFKAAAYAKQGNPNNAYDQAVGAAYSYEGRHDAKLDVRESYLNTEDPASTELTQRQRRWLNTVSTRGQYTAARGLVFGLDAADALHKYVGPQLGALLNRHEITAGGDVGFLVQPKTRAYLAFHEEKIHYTAGRQADSRTHMVDAGLEGLLTPVIAGKAQAGMALRRYDADQTGTARQANTWQADTTLTYRFSEATRYTLRAYRSFQEAVLGGNRFYTATGFALGASHKPRHLGVHGAFGLEVDRYPDQITVGALTGVRRDDLYQATVGLDYDLSGWLGLGFEYQRLQRNSVFTSEFNYGVDRTSLEARATF